MGQGQFCREPERRDRSSEAITNLTDLPGRVYKSVFSDGNSAQSYFNPAGQLWKQRDSDGVVVVFSNNIKGELEYTALDLSLSDSTGQTGTNRLTRVTNDVVTAHSTTVFRTRVWQWATNYVDSPSLVSTTERSVDGLQSWVTQFGLTSSSALSSPSSGLWITMATNTDGSYTITTNQNGRTISVTQRDSGGGSLGQITYSYDPHGRRYMLTDLRNGTMTNFFDVADRVVTNSSPSPDGSSASLITVNSYDNRNRIWKTVLPDGTSVTNGYLATGEVGTNAGSRTYPVEYTFDYAGRLATLKTWRDRVGNAGSATNTWTYDGYRGFLTNKTYPDTTPIGFSYTPAGRLKTRVWGRGAAVTNGYNSGGDLVTMTNNSGGTSNLNFGYDRRGLLATINQGTITTSRLYSDAGQLIQEAQSGGPLNGLILTNSFDAYLRRSSVALSNQVTTYQSFVYDSASRFSIASDGTNQIGYAYTSNSPLLGRITFTNNAALRLTTTRTNDLLNRLLAEFSEVSSNAYAYNQANQRTNRFREDGSRWGYQYDKLGQVTLGKRYWTDLTPVAGQQFEYVFDDIGNRSTSKSGGDSAGSNLRTATYGVNTVNEYTNRTVPGYLEVQGTATNLATVTVNLQPSYRLGGYFRTELAVDNSSAAIWQAVTNVAVRTNGSSPDYVTTNSGYLFLPKASEKFWFDADGNLLGDGRWTNTWNAENQLVSMQSVATGPTGSLRKLDFTYDYAGRRIQKIVSTNNGGVYTGQSTNRFVYDGWNLIAVLDPAGSILQSFRWGQDLSGTMQGAGGVGGLVSMTIHSGAQAGTYFYGFDGNGNVMALINATNGAVAARYEYGPFGELLRASGPLALLNPFRFSTKYQDDETDLTYFGYRYYSASAGRWLGRDPIEEEGGANLLGFLGNDPVGLTDSDGRSPQLQTLYATRGPDGRFILMQGAGYTFDYDQSRGVKGAINQGSPRFSAGVGLVGSVFEAGAAVALGAAPDPTLATKAGAILLAGHSYDTWSANWAQLMTGQYQQTITSQLFGPYVDLGLGFSSGLVYLRPDVLAMLARTSATANAARCRSSLSFVNQGDALAPNGIRAEASLWSKAEFNETRVYQRSDLIDPALVDARGRSNLQRMQEGLAPIGPDGKSINLHHTIQTADSPLAEITATFHQQNSRVIHINPNTMPSGIDRPAFDAFRRDYWINRANSFSP